MALKAILASLDGLPKEIAAEYTKAADGSFVLSVEGMVLKSSAEAKIEEGNRKKAELGAEVERLKAELSKAPSSDEFQRYKTTIEDLENGRGGEKLKKVIEREIEAKQRAFEDQIRQAKEQHAAEKARADKASADLKIFRVKQEVGSAALEAGIKKKGITAYLDLAARDFELIGEGEAAKVVPVKRAADGSFSPIIGENFEAMSPKDFISKNHRAEASALSLFFETGSGGGAGSGNPRPGASGGGGLHLSREQARDPQVYKAAKEQAAKAGTAITVEPQKL